MAAYRVIPLDEELAWKVRGSLRAPDYRHPAYVDTADSVGPCRVCLRPFRVGADRRILFTYDPFRRHEPFPLPSPVQIHEAGCPRYTGHRLPAELSGLPLTFEGYGPGRELIAEERHAATAEAESAIARILGRPSVAYVHVRDTATGFFICELDRGGVASTTAAGGAGATGDALV
ncbi:DUF1203 domain-containing protein [Micromonospora phytophila]|uniref:DUF1203 domain-containing protein n=1 Tax=Micromonospora phytophila TaxID=709888 RepID=UPI00202F2E75|nr:DUF1203 domain-containing protein [Micromonospora phytophila]MCM0678869.1 DUF1203 domain-containing protein [Micromonospora phytophila]